MTRSIFAAAAAFAFIGLVTAPGCKATGVGDPCTPEQEYDPTFGGFAVDEVNVESKSFQCQTRLCLVNHFRGRVTCPYGQDANRAAPAGAEACYTPAGKNPDDPNVNIVTGATIGSSTTRDATVEPQCTDRTADKAVYCSCRCANVDGRTDDGASYCGCPDGFTCEPLVSSIGALDSGLTGSYCIKTGTAFDRNSSCQTPCAPNGAVPCPSGT